MPFFTAKNAWMRSSERLPITTLAPASVRMPYKPFEITQSQAIRSFTDSCEFAFSQGEFTSWKECISLKSSV